MNLLFLTPQLPYPPRQGAAIRNYNFIAQLTRRHTIDLLTFLAPGEQLSADNPLHRQLRRVMTLRQPLRTTTQRVRDSALTALPDMGLRLATGQMHQLVEVWTRESDYDVVQIEGIEMAPYLASISRQRGDVRPMAVFDDHNCEYLLQKRNALTDLRRWRRWPAAAYSLVQWQKLWRYERAVCRQADAVVAVSSADKAALTRLDARLRVAVVSNGIDLTKYAFSDKENSAPASAGQQKTLIFVGKMDYRPNIDAALWFGEQVLPLVTARIPDARFQIVGMNPHPRLDKLRNNPAIEITGAVDDVQPLIHAAAVYVIPLRIGGGTRFKALEAMACGAPVVSTSLGVEGIGVSHGSELLMADTPQSFADAVLTLLEPGNRLLRQALAVNARHFVERRYGWDRIVPRLDEIYAQGSSKERMSCNES
jgi:sugar transferase (PEP-CTERM/EpsH1 system associated)